MEKLTDTEIVMALKEHINLRELGICSPEMPLKFLKLVLDVITHQKAEIENLMKFCNDFSETLSNNYKKAELQRVEEVDKAKFEAYKEFWDRLKKEADFISGGDYGFSFEIREDVAEGIIKELTEDNK
jgi:hypothetical protein